jgi:Zn finger protein HypA/HybF involved in hydrogenase expression
LAPKSQLSNDVTRGHANIILKCTECGNTFSKDCTKNEEIVCCPICEAQYKAVIKSGKLYLEDYVFEEKDLGEL